MRNFNYNEKFNRPDKPKRLKPSSERMQIWYDDKGLKQWQTGKFNGLIEDK